MGQQWPAAGLWALSGAVHVWELLKEVAIIFITSTIVWSQVKQHGGNTALPINRKLDWDLLSMAPPTRTIPSFPQSQSLSSASFHRYLIYSSEGRHNENHNCIKLIKLITWTTALFNSMKLWAMPCRPPKMDGSWWRLLTKRGPLDKGMANHFSILALRIPQTVWKGKNIWHRKLNSPGQ